MRDRRRILANLESLYRTEFESAQKDGDRSRMSKLDFDFQKEQLVLEVLLDIRDALGSPAPPDESETLLDKAEKLRRITKLR